MSEYYSIDTFNTLSEKVENDTVVINLGTGVYYNLNLTSSHIWNLITCGFSREEVVAEYGSVFQIDRLTAENDVSGIISLLLEQKLIFESSSPMPGEKCKADVQPYEKPNIEQFTDMQEMLLLDPIHEVTEEGWPYKK